MNSLRTPALLMEGVSLRVKNRLLLSDFSLRVDKGTFHGLIGSNGSGKTSVMELAVGFRKPTTGRIEILGSAPTPRRPALLRRIGIAAQNPGFLPRSSVREHLLSIAEIFGSTIRDVDILLEALMLEDCVDTRVEEISVSERQRLAVASAVVHRPEILFLDEPTANLDHEARRNLVSLLRSSNIIGTTTLYTTRRLDEIETLCDEVTILDKPDTFAQPRRYFAAERAMPLPVFGGWR